MRPQKCERNAQSLFATILENESTFSVTELTFLGSES